MRVVATRPVVSAVIFDLDGVIRHYDRAHEARIERRHGLAPGTLVSSAFGADAGREFMCGRLDHEEFAVAIGDIVGAAAAGELVAMRAVVDHEAVRLVRDLQARVPVALLTNGSVRTDRELEEAGLHDAFHHVVNSAVTGIPKPEPGAYLHALAALGTDPAATAFVDDHEPNVAGAAAVGLVGHLYTGLGPLRRFLADHGAWPGAIVG